MKFDLQASLDGRFLQLIMWFFPYFAHKAY